MNNPDSHEIILCSYCGRIFEKAGNRHCSNCFACTGCERYYCPLCDTEIIISPVRKAGE